MYTRPGESGALLMPKAKADFVETAYVRQLASCALDYIRVGLPVHLSGPAGTGKTTLALHVAAKTGRPVVLICGDYELSTPDFVGGVYSYRKTRVVDNFIRTVVKADESMDLYWTDGRLVSACKNGFTLVYDEFARSRPEANNVLLSVLEERMLPLPAAAGRRDYLKVHPDFVAIFTSNPRDYAGVQKIPDALLDRMVTMEIGNFDEETETAITQAKAKIPIQDAQRIVEIVRRVREAKSERLTPTVRSSIVIGKLLRLRNSRALREDSVFRQTCVDVLMPCVPSDERKAVERVIHDTIRGYVG